MPEPLSDSRRKDKRGRASQGPEVPVAGLLRDCIVGITCFPDPLPRSAKRKWRSRSRDAKRS
jgi:hypothetical protein